MQKDCRFVKNVLYMMLFGDCVKIGIATDLFRRINNYSHIGIIPTVVFSVVHDFRDRLESNFIKKYEHKNIRSAGRETFLLSDDEVVSAINENFNPNETSINFFDGIYEPTKRITDIIDNYGFSPIVSKFKINHRFDSFIYNRLPIEICRNPLAFRVWQQTIEIPHEFMSSCNPN